MIAGHRDAETVGLSWIGWLSFLTLFVVGTDTFLVAPLLPVLRGEFGIGVSRSGWLVSAYAVGYAATALVAGPRSDRVDRRRMLLGGMVAFAGCTGACAVVWGFWGLIGTRFLAGVAAAFATPQIWASIPILVPRERLMQAFGRATSGLAIAQLAGIPIGALLAAISWRASFAVIALLAAATTVLLAIRFPSVPPAVGGTTGFGYAAVMRRPSLMIALLAYLVFQSGNLPALSFIGTWFARDFGLGPVGIGLALVVIGVGNATGSLTGHRIVDRLGVQRSLGTGLLAIAGGYIVLAMTRSLAPAVVLLGLVMAVAGMVFPVLMSVLQDQAEGARGTVSSLANVAMYAGTTVGIAVAGPIFVATPQFSGVALLTVCTTLAALGLFRLAGVLRGPSRG